MTEAQELLQVVNELRRDVSILRVAEVKVSNVHTSIEACGVFSIEWGAALARGSAKS